MKKILISIVLLLAVVVSIVYFTNFRSNEETPSDVTLKVGYIPVTHCLPLYVAIERGFFSDYHLNIELVSLAGGAKILEALAAGEVDIGFSNVVSPILGRSEGLPFFAFTGGPVEDSTHKDHAILVQSHSAIENVSDLKGKKLAINSRRNIDHLMILMLLKKAGLTESDVKLLEVPFPRMLTVLKAGSVDAIAAAEPFITLGLEQDDVRVLSWNYIDVRMKTLVSTYVTTDVIRSKQSNNLRDFASALGKGIEILDSDPKYAREVLSRFTRISEDVAQKVRLPGFRETVDKVNVMQTIDMLRETGLLSKEVIFEEVFGEL